MAECSSTASPHVALHYDDLKMLIKGYLEGSRTQVPLSQCVAFLQAHCVSYIGSIPNTETMRDVIRNVALSLSGDIQGDTYHPSNFRVEKERSLRRLFEENTFVSTSMVISSGLHLDSSWKDALGDRDAVFLTTRQNMGFACSSSIRNALVDALVDILSPTSSSPSDEWWLYTPSLLPTAFSDEEAAALLLHCVDVLKSRSPGGDEKQVLIVAGLYAARVALVDMLRDGMLSKCEMMKRAISRQNGPNCDSKAAVATYLTKKYAVALFLQVLKSTGNENEELVRFLGTLWETYLHSIVERIFDEIAKRAIQHKKRNLLLHSTKTSKASSETVRDIIFERMWHSLLLSAKARKFTRNAVSGNSRHCCAAVAALLTVFACYDNNVNVPSTLLGHYAVQHSDGTVEYDFESDLDLPLLLGMASNTAVDAVDAVVLNKDELKRLSNELPRATSSALVKLRATFDQESTEDSFCQYLQDEGGAVFRVIVKGLEKKREKQLIAELRLEYSAVLQQSTLFGTGPPAQPSLASIVQLCEAGPNTVEFLTYMMAAAYVELTSGSQGVPIGVPTPPMRDLQSWMHWLETEVKESDSTTEQAERRGVVDALKTKLHTVDCAVCAHKDASAQKTK